ncbi:MAG: BtpA/SgcQ family protein [Candidatus Sumerlaeia bacterium]|nr:BtpA/SgcQ family protein [Candidatus Sumerlaeia bacterium]
MELPVTRLVGMIHAAALPGTPRHSLPLEKIVTRAVDEALQLADAGFEMLLLENMHDVPYLRRKVGPEIVSAMTIIAIAIRKATKLPLGIQILAGANCEAMAVAMAADCAFIRAEGFVFSHVADEGLMNGDAAELLRYRKQIGADSISIYTDIKKKHSSHAITADLTLGETAKAAAFFCSDGVIVTGSSTGDPTSVKDLEEVRRAVDIPVIVGSGTTPENLPQAWPHTDLFVVGSTIKVDGKWHNPVDPARARTIVEVARRLAKNGTAQQT